MDAARDREVTAIDLLGAYASGIFPMAVAADDLDVYWVDPERRGIIPLDAGFRIPRALRKVLKKRPFAVTINAAFDDVIAACGQATDARRETWINPRIRGWFCELHRLGFAHSVECRDGAGQLVGGLYGLSLNGAFFGESMFSRASEASKVALVHLVARLRARGFRLLDSQFVNPHLLQFGCVEISRDDYHSRLEAALSLDGVAFAGAAGCGVAEESDWGAVLESFGIG